ncbi:MAG: hypothetical protein HeimC3_31020 [Candidatus Heimdallarchaeota archaeon LC_3]|nr:MAG: hypothetical protein HeimC3_31020 [Candidatus Heimdallarchaeota archaeon LC_3]
MGNNISNLGYTSFFLFGILLILTGSSLLFILDILNSTNFGLISGIILGGFLILAVCINWLRNLLKLHHIIKDIINFLGFILIILGSWFLLIRTIALPPNFEPNDIGIYWFTQSFNLLWSFLPVIVIFFGFYLYKIAEYFPKKEDER